MSESKKHVAVIGCGYWGKNLVRDFHGLGALAAVSDSHKPTALEMSEKYDVPSRSIEEILADDNIDDCGV